MGLRLLVATTSLQGCRSLFVYWRGRPEQPAGCLAAPRSSGRAPGEDLRDLASDLTNAGRTAWDRSDVLAGTTCWPCAWSWRRRRVVTAG